LKSILIIAVVMESGNHKLRARNRNFYESHKCGTQNQSSGQASCSTRFISVLQAFLFSLVDFHSSDVHTLAIVICNCIFYHCIKLSWVYLAIIWNLQHEKEIIAKTPEHRRKRKVIESLPFNWW